MNDFGPSAAIDQVPRRNFLLGLLGAVIVVLVALAWWLGFLTPEPDVVSLAATVEAVSSAPDNATADAAATDGDAAERDSAATNTGSADSIAGTWSVAQQEATFAGYRADGTTGEAVGRTPNVTGTLEATDAQIAAVNITVDMTMLTSDSSLRDDHLGDEGLEYRTYPTSTFVLTEPIQIDEIPTDGASLVFDAVGELTVRDTTLPVVVVLEGALIDQQLIVVGSTDINLDDYGASVSSTDAAVLEFSLVFQQ